jgi:hypothetical protein
VLDLGDQQAPSEPILDRRSSPAKDEPDPPVQAVRAATFAKDLLAAIEPEKPGKVERHGFDRARKRA